MLRKESEILLELLLKSKPNRGEIYFNEFDMNKYDINNYFESDNQFHSAVNGLIELNYIYNVKRMGRTTIRCVINEKSYDYFKIKPRLEHERRIKMFVKLYKQEKDLLNKLLQNKKELNEYINLEAKHDFGDELEELIKALNSKNMFREFKTYINGEYDIALSSNAINYYEMENDYLESQKSNVNISDSIFANNNSTVNDVQFNNKSSNSSINNNSNNFSEIMELIDKINDNLTTAKLDDKTQEDMKECLSYVKSKLNENNVKVSLFETSVKKIKEISGGISTALALHSDIVKLLGLLAPIVATVS